MVLYAHAPLPPSALATGPHRSLTSADMPSSRMGTTVWSRYARMGSDCTLRRSCNVSVAFCSADSTSATVTEGAPCGGTRLASDAGAGNEMKCTQHQQAHNIIKHTTNNKQNQHTYICRSEPTREMCILRSMTRQRKHQISTQSSQERVFLHAFGGATNWLQETHAVAVVW